MNDKSNMTITDDEKFQYGYHVLCLLDHLGQSAKLRALDELGFPDKQTPEFIRMLKDTFGVIHAVEEWYKSYFQGWERENAPAWLASVDQEMRDIYTRCTDCGIKRQQFGDTHIFYASVLNIGRLKAVCDFSYSSSPRSSASFYEKASHVK